MMSRRLLLTGVVTAAVTNSASAACVSAFVEPSEETASLLNGVFWSNTDRATRDFYVRAVGEVLALHVRDEPRTRTVGFTLPEMVEWIDGFYKLDPTFPQLPLAMVCRYGHRAQHGESRELLVAEAKSQLTRIRSIVR